MGFLELLKEEHHADFLALSQIVDLSRGELLIRRGERSDDLFLLTSGNLEVVDTRSTPELVLSTMGPGSLFGELSFFERTTRTADVRATGPVQCHRWNGAALKRELSEKPILAAHFYEALSAIIAERARGMSEVAVQHSERAPIEGGEDLHQQAHALVASARTAWIEAERSLRLDPGDRDAQRQIYAQIQQVLQESVRWISGKGDPGLKKLAGEALSRELHPFLMRSRLGALLLEGSEIRRVAHILLNERQGTGPLGEGIDRALLSLPTSAGLRRRTALAGQTLLSHLPDRPVALMAINVFSGVVLNRLFPRLARHGADVTCLDGDREALSSADLGQSNMPSAIRLKLAHTDLAQLCMGRIRDPYPPQDFILVDGLVDYLPDQLAAGMLAWCRSNLRPGGRMLLTGTAPSQEAPLFDYLLNWPMIRRPARDLRALADSVGLRGSVVAGGGKSNIPAVVVTATNPG